MGSHTCASWEQKTDGVGRYADVNHAKTEGLQCFNIKGESIMGLLNVSAAQVRKNRRGIAEMWERIPAKWIELDTFLASDEHNPKDLDDGEYSRTDLVKMCDGKDGPHNECGAVGCFAGWNWTYHPYQTWCRRHKLTIASTTNLSIYLGLQVSDHGLFDGRHNRHLKQSEQDEVKDRVKELLRMSIFEDVQYSDSK